MKNALLIVDYQYDFVADDGALTTGKPAQNIESKIAKLASTYSEDDIYFTLDAHLETDWEKSNVYPETKKFEKHCIKDTKGYELYGKIKGMNIVKNHIEKRAYCPNYEFLLKMIKSYDEVTVVGLVTDICVFQTVIGLFTTAVNNEIPIKIKVDKSCCASFNPEREKWALDYLADVLGIEIMNS